GRRQRRPDVDMRRRDGGRRRRSRLLSLLRVPWPDRLSGRAPAERVPLVRHEPESGWGRASRRRPRLRALSGAASRAGHRPGRARQRPRLLCLAARPRPTRRAAAPAAAAGAVAWNPDAYDMSTIDVVIPCYRYGRYLRECVESVLAQGVAGLR